MARAATSVRQVESSHPCECAEQLLPLHCPGAAQLHLHFDARTQLPGGARLGVYLDAACTYELLTLEAEDAAAAETLCVPAGRAWLLLSSEQNREHAWGFKALGLGVGVGVGVIGVRATAPTRASRPCAAPCCLDIPPTRCAPRHVT